MIQYLVDLTNKYPIISIEDPVDENDWEGFRKITEKLGDKIQGIQLNRRTSAKISVQLYPPS